MTDVSIWIPAGSNEYGITITAIYRKGKKEECRKSWGCRSIDEVLTLIKDLLEGKGGETK